MLTTGIENYTNSMYPVQAGWNIVKARNILARRPDLDYLYPLTDDAFWSRFDLIDFWANLDLWQGALYFWDKLVEMFGVENIYICTSGLSPSAAAGKTIWVKKNLKGFDMKKLFIGYSKYMLAGPDRILIDDRDKNCLDFYEAGGQSVLVPRPWNSANMVRDDMFQTTISTLHLMNVSLPE
jgi:hypothetical protein